MTAAATVQRGLVAAQDTIHAMRRPVRTRAGGRDTCERVRKHGAIDGDTPVVAGAVAVGEAFLFANPAATRERRQALGVVSAALLETAEPVVQQGRAHVDALADHVGTGALETPLASQAVGVDRAGVAANVVARAHRIARAIECALASELVRQQAHVRRLVAEHADRVVASLHTGPASPRTRCGSDERRTRGRLRTPNRASNPHPARALLPRERCRHMRRPRRQPRRHSRENVGWIVKA